MLAEATLARPYARAAFRAAEAVDALDAWTASLTRVAELVEVPAFHELLGDPRVEDGQLVDLVSEVAGEDMDESRRNFFRLLVENRRLGLAGEIARQFEQQRRASEKRLKVRITAAAELGEAQREHLAERLGKRFGAEIEMETAVDPDLLGGIVVRAGDQVIDASVRGRLEQLGRQLSR